jgi:AmpD protein
MFRVNLSTGLILPAQFIASPNYNQRPDNIIIDMIVIHNISLPPGKFGGEDVIKLFTNQLDYMKDLKVSAHLWIRRGGEIIQFVPFHLRAWHAGVSSFRGQENCNNFSIGIELEGTDTLPYTDVQYAKLRDIIAVLKKGYSAIVDERIVGHSDIAPGRKTDPGQFFRWDFIK